MKNIECIICGGEVLLQLQKRFESRKYCSDKCKNIPSIFHRWDDYEV